MYFAKKYIDNKYINKNINNNNDLICSNKNKNIFM